MGPTGAETKNDCAGNLLHLTGLYKIFLANFSQESEGSQRRQSVKHSHESRGTRNQESQCW
jgi:hypothetical protein